MKLRNPFAADEPKEDRGRKPLLAPLSPRVTCEAEGCRQESRVFTRARNLCEWHYTHEHTDAARAYAHENDLHSARDHIEHCKRMAATFGKLWSRERLIAHWRNVQAAPECHIAGEFAAQALANLHAGRVVGEDDE